MPKKNNSPDEKMSRIESMDNILNGMNIAILVSDMVTNEILYANAELRRMYRDAPLIGKICWESLKNESKRCKDCPISRLLKNPEESYQHVIHEEDKCFQINDSIIPWSGGKLAHLRYIVEITV